MENAEDILEALHSFNKSTPITEQLEDFLHIISKTGDTFFPWTIVKPFLIKKLDNVMCELYQRSKNTTSMSTESFSDIKTRLLDYLDSFVEAPFTVQRLAELLIEPNRYYANSDKFLRGVEKNILVVSTVEPNYNKKLISNHKIDIKAVSNGVESSDEAVDFAKHENHSSGDNNNSDINFSSQLTYKALDNDSNNTTDNSQPTIVENVDRLDAYLEGTLMNSNENRPIDDMENDRSTDVDNRYEKTDLEQEDDDTTPPVSPPEGMEEEALNFGRVVIPKESQNALRKLTAVVEKDVVNSNHTTEDTRLFLANDNAAQCKYNAVLGSDNVDRS